MATQVHPDKRIDDLEKRLAAKDKEIAQLRKSVDELSRRLASIQGVVSTHSTSISRLNRSGT